MVTDTAHLSAPRKGIYFSIFTGGGCGWALTNVSVNLAAGLAENGHTVDLVTLYESKDTLQAYYRDVDGFAKVRIQPLGIKHARSSIFKLIRYFRARRPDVVFSQLTYFNAIAVFARYLSRTKIKNILLEGTIISKVGSVDVRENLKMKLVPPLVRLTYPMADGLICKSPSVLEDLRGILGNRVRGMQLCVLPNPYSLDRLHTLAGEDVTLPWLAMDGTPIILSIGRLALQKAHDVLIRAFSTVRKEVPCRLLILGEGPQRESLEKLVRDLDISSYVAMPGVVKNPWKYMARCTIFVLASRWEGWPSALTEAMALGMPVITTDCPGGGKVIVRSNENGIVVPVDDVPAVSEAILKLVTDDKLRKQLACMAKERARQYDYRILAGEYAKFAGALLD